MAPGAFRGDKSLCKQHNIDMQVSSSLMHLSVGVLYPLWLAAGAIDYICHRVTRIERTSGPIEAWFHVAQFLVLGLAFAAALQPITLVTFTIVAVCVVTHSSLAFIDTSYSFSRRYISPLEQQVHGFMDVLPVVGLCLWTISNWSSIAGATWTIHGKDLSVRLDRFSLLFVGFFLLAGLLIFEELMRTLRVQSRPTIKTSLLP